MNDIKIQSVNHVAQFLGEAPKETLLLAERVVADGYRKITPAYRTFFALKEDFWKQIFDGVVHDLGPLVFDLGSHGHTVEPGYYKGVERACHFVSRHFENEPNVRFYKLIHRVACEHLFKIRMLNKYEVGAFRGPTLGLNCYGHYSSVVPQMTSADKKRHQNDLHLLDCRSRYFDWAVDSVRQKTVTQFKCSTEQEFIDLCEKAKQRQDQLSQELVEKIGLTNRYLQEHCKSLGIDRVAFLDIESKEFPCSVKVIYLIDKVDEMIQMFFARFSKAIAAAKTDREKIVAIADLFQMLEWVHPFRDGQGRTDLILLGWLLCKYGLNPSILRRPYHSTFAPLESWRNYLEKGIERWQQLKSSAAVKGK